jgi:hypothetical protein
MRGLAGTDRRALQQVFVHETFQPCKVEAASADALPSLPESIRKAIEGLPGDDLKTIAREGIERYGGICTRSEFTERFTDGRNISWQSATFLRELGGRGLGTVGHLDLRARGLGVDDDALLLFHEVVERYVAEWRAEALPRDAVLTAHGDLMSDVATALDVIREGQVKVSKEGSVYKASRARLAERLQFPEQPLLDRIEVADKVLGIVRGLGLAATDGGNRLAVTEAGDAWNGRSLLDKIRSAYERLLQDGPQSLRARHLRGVRAHLVALLGDGADEAAWWPGRSLGLLARNRYLLDLEREDRTINGAQLTVRSGALSELGRAAQELATRDLFALGLVEVALHGGAAAGVRLSRLGRRLLLDRPAEVGTRPMVVNPDFELMVLPEGDVDELLHALDRVAERTRSGEVVHFRLDRARIERVAVAGGTAEDLIGFLAAHARAPLPQNVTYSIRSWSGDVRTAALARGLLLVASDPAVIEAVQSHPALKDLVAQVVNGTALFFADGADETRIAQELKTLGVYQR